MNRVEKDVLMVLSNYRFENQRKISERTHFSLGTVNRAVNCLIEEGYLFDNYSLTDKGFALIKNNKPQSAVILAAGAGMRLIPVNYEIPKAFIEVDGEALIERLINQLHSAGIEKIYVVVGYMKEAFEYLIDKYNIELIVNTEYFSKNNIYSLYLALEKINGSYIIPCDIWLKNNPFNYCELYSWYMVTDSESMVSNVRIRKNHELIKTNRENGNTMVGVAYVSKEDSLILRNLISDYLKRARSGQSFWEDAAFESNSINFHAKTIKDEDYAEINTYEQLINFGSNSNQLETSSINAITESLKCEKQEIKDISPLKKGMTNRSFLFRVRDEKYIMRIPGEGTDKLINRRNEALVYKTINNKDICDDIVYINPENGYKITKFINGSRTCNPDDNEDLRKCMKKLRAFHENRYCVEHSFDLYAQIEFYESLWCGQGSIYRDYDETKSNVLRLKDFIDSCTRDMVLTHIDAVPDNFLIYNDANGNEHIRLIDWEYSGMQDPHVDIAMFSIYSLYNREQIDNLIDIYFENKCTKNNRLKIYCYVAVCGLLWSNWCEYKRQLGVEFREYSLKQYRYAKTFYKIFSDEFDKINGDSNA